MKRRSLKMRRFLNSDLFILLWGASILIYWPAGVVLSILGLAGNWYERKIKRTYFHKALEQF
ncbi:MAG: hypothetical protein ACI4F1_01995, partial [Bariatricus sp.]